MTLCELQVITYEQFQTRPMNQSSMRSEIEVAVSSFEIQQSVLYCSR